MSNTAKAYFTPMAGSSVIHPNGARITFVMDTNRRVGVYATSDPEELEYLEYLASRPSSQVRHDQERQAMLDAHAKAADKLQPMNAAANIAQNVTVNANGEIITGAELDQQQQAIGVVQAAQQLNAALDPAKVAGSVPVAGPAGLEDLAALAAKIHATSGIANTANQVVVK